MLIYTLKSLFRKKAYTLFSMIAVVLFIAGILSALNIKQMISDGYEYYLNDKYGKYTIITTESLTNLKLDDQIISFGFLYCYKLSFDFDSVLDQVSIGYLDSHAFELSPIHLKTGRWPQNKTEVVVEQTVFDALSGAGLSNMDLSDTEVGYVLNIVGTIENYSAIQRIGYWPQIITGAPLDNHIERDVCSIVRLSSDADLELLAQENHTSLFVSNQYNENSFESFIDSSTNVLIEIFTASIVLLSFISLLGFLSLGKTSLISQIHDLHYVCASPSQIRFFILCNSFLVFLVSLPLGITLSFLFQEFFYKNVLYQLIPNNNIIRDSFNIESIVLLGFLVLLIFVSRVLFVSKEIKNLYKPAISLQTTVRPKHGFFHSVSSCLLKWELCNIKRRNKAYLAIIIALSASFLILFFEGVFLQTVSNEYDIEYSDHITLRSYDGSYYSFLQISENPSFGFRDTEVQRLNSCSEVAEVSTIRNLNVLIEDVNKKLSKNPLLKNVQSDFNVDDLEYQKELNHYGVHATDSLFSSQLRACNTTMVNTLLNLLGHDYNTFDPKEQVIILCYDPNRCPYQKGDIICFYSLCPEKGTNSVDTLYYERTVYDVINMSFVKNWTYKLNGTSFDIACSEESLQKKDLNHGINSVFINLKTIEDSSLTTAIIEDIKRAHPDISIVSEIENAAEKKRIVNTLFSIATVLTAFLYCFIIISTINILSATYLFQMRLWGVLRTIGLNGRKIIIIHCCEMIFLCLIAEIISFVLIICIGMIIRKDVNLFSLPLILAYFLVPFFISLFSMPLVMKPFKNNIIEQIHYIE